MKGNKGIEKQEHWEFYLDEAPTPTDLPLCQSVNIYLDAENTIDVSVLPLL